MKKRIRVAFAVNDFLVGGVQRLYLDLFETLSPQEFEIHLVTLMRFPEKRELYESIPRHVIVHQLDFKRFRDLRAWWQCVRELSRMRPDVVVSSLFFSNTVLRVLQPFLRYRVIAIEQNTYIAKTRLQIMLDRLLAHLTYRIVAVSATVLAFTQAQESIPAEKFILIRNGIDLSRTRESASTADPEGLRREVGLFASDRVVLNVARLTEQKNQRALIEAFAVFGKEHPEYKLVIVGEGTLKLSFERLIEQHNARRFIILTGVREDIASFYALADFLVSTSFIEGMSIAQMEALANGVPLLATRTAGTDEMIEEGVNGYFISAPDAVSIQNGLEKMANADRGAMRTAARISAKQFDMHETARAYAALIRESL